MIRNYFKIAVRNLLKYRFISFINLFGLTVGLTCCLLITTYIINELSYDRYNENADNIYRVTRSFNNQDGVVSLNLSTVSAPFGYYMPTDFPEIKKMTRLYDNGISPFRYQDKLINEPHMYFADENLTTVFSVKMLQGNGATALLEPYQVMMTPETAKKYFGNEDPMNKVIRYNNLINLKVSGIYEPFPANAHVHPQLLVSFNTMKDSLVYGEKNLRTGWGNNSFFTYLLLPPKYDPATLEARFPAFLDNHMAGEYGGQTPSRFTKLALQRLTDIHLYSHTDYEAEPNSDIKRVYIFGAIAFFILLIACINYMNLSTARSALRAREIGIRKVIGARRKELIWQFLSESVLISWLAILLAIGLLFLTMPWLNKITEQQLSVRSLLQWQVLIPVILTPFVVGVVAGIYPALFMSGFQPIKTLKGLFKPGGGNVSFRKVLVVTQFAISIILIITTAVVFRQLHYMQQKSLGFDKDHLVILNYNRELNTQFEAFRNELLADASIRSVARSSRIPSGRLLDNMGASTVSGDSLKPTTTDLKFVSVDYDFFPAYGIKITAGRNFSRDFGTDTASFVINDLAAKSLGWTSSNAIGKDFKYGGTRGHIIGTVADFHFESMHQPIVPMIFVIFPEANNYFNNVTVKIAGNNIPAAMAHLEKTWRKFSPETPFQSNFLDDNFNTLYNAEKRQGNIFTVFAGIAILIACLGLFGLSAFTITQRIKEIGIRKVLGASTGSIVSLLSKDFLLLVGIAALIAFPVAWLAMDTWLRDFAYRISMPWWIFILAAIIAGAVALATVSLQAVKAALSNPVKSLRTE
ncbi:MAG TPA: ABC transporter permease [Chitinophagaceae bacterium]|nr:ABC transporter permease [Chitinophagaceae bacterium]